jgi:hypothetical protein
MAARRSHFFKQSGVIAATVILALQACMVIRARFVESRYFCWSPHSTQVRFDLDVTVNGRKLSRTEAAQRYRLWDSEWEAHAPQNLIDTIESFESTYGKREQAEVFLRYQVNGSAESVWHWPR